jgi:hypothetical protein
MADGLVTTARQFAEDLSKHLALVVPTGQQMTDAAVFVGSRRDLRREPASRGGPEYIVEAFVRPLVEAFVSEELERLPSIEHDRVYSSHFHTSRASEAEHERRWASFKRAHRDVDTDDKGHSRRADLFVSFGAAGLVSVECKYSQPCRTVSVESCRKQIKQHLSKHLASVLVIYAGVPLSRGMPTAVDAIRSAIAPISGFVTLIEGPPIQLRQALRGDSA